MGAGRLSPVFASGSRHQEREEYPDQAHIDDLDIISFVCGRYRLSRRKQILEEYFDTAPWDEEWAPRYNVAPTQPVPVVRQHPKDPIRHLSLMKWGLIPSWAKSPSIASSTINAKSETAATRPAFRDPMKFRRCLIPADGFYEWKRTGNRKQPFCFEVGTGELFAFAGLWDGWKRPDGNWTRTCTILTTTPNVLTSTVHDRMPVILEPNAYDLWLNPRMSDVGVLTALLKPYDAELMHGYPVGKRVNSAANDDEECSRRVEIVDAQQHLKL